MMKLLMALMIPTLAVSACEKREGPQDQPYLAIYFLHVGQSDKPLWPFVLSQRT